MKILRYNNNPFMNKALRKPITTRSRLKNKFNISNKGLNSNNILLVEGNEIVNNDGRIVTIMNRYFTNITKHMNLKARKISHREELVNILDTFKNHKSVQRIKNGN